MARSFIAAALGAASCLIPSFSTFAAPAAPDAGDIVARRYLKEVQERPLDVTRFAVIARDAATRDALATQLDLLGIGRDSATPFTHGDVQIIDLPVALRTSEGVRGVLAGVLATPNLAFATPMMIDAQGGAIIPLPQIFVGVADGVSNDEAAELIEKLGVGTVTQFNRHPGVHVVTPTARDGFAAIEAANLLADLPQFAFAECDEIVRVYGEYDPTDGYFDDSWYHYNDGAGWYTTDIDVDSPQAWDIETGSSSVIVAILDNGVEQDHPDIHQVTPGEDMTSLAFLGYNGGPIYDYDNHGTPVAGLVSAWMNGSGSVGVCPDCRTISIKIAYDTDAAWGWTSQSSWIADGVWEADNRGARITNSSFIVGSSSTLTNAYVLTSGIMLHFGAAGNGGGDGIGDPSLDYPSSIGVVQSVAALDPDGTLTSFSNWGSGLDFAAPGDDLWTTDRTGSDGYAGGSWTTFGGTSGASPIAAGVAALIWSTDLSMTPSEVVNWMQDYAKNLGPGGYDTTYGYGIPKAFGPVLEIAFGNECSASGNCYASHATPGCSNESCCFTVCIEDSFCCNVSWDGICANEAIEFCTNCGDAGAGSCFASHGTPGCESSACCDDVCEVDSYCCNNQWDGICVNEAWDFCTPESDICSEAIALTTGVPYSFNTTNATTEGTAYALCDFFGDDQIHKDVWFKWTATCDSWLTVSTCGTADFDTKIAVFGPGLLGGSCPGGIFGGYLMACNDDVVGCSGNTSKITVAVYQGSTYRIRLGGFNGDSGEGSILATCNVPNDICSSSLEVFDGTTLFSTAGALTEGPQAPNCDGGAASDVSKDVWFHYEATCTGPLVVDTCQFADFDTKLAVYAPNAFSGSSCPGGFFGGILLDCNDDSTSCEDPYNSQVIVNVVEGKTYRIRVGGYSGASGHGTLSIACGSPCVGDLDQNGVVDGGDLGELLGQWGGNGSADLNDDNLVDGADYGLLLGNWGECD